jgi:Flp pilus assembly protein CpaB
MRTRVILIVALIIVIVLAVAAFLFTQQEGGGGGADGTSEPRATVAPAETLPPTATPIPVAEVIIAIQDIPRGVEIQPNMVEVIAFPVDFLPQGTFSDLNAVIGRIARTDISREQLIQSRQIITGPFTQAAADLGRIGSDAAAVLEAGRVAIALPIDAVTSVAYALQPGDSVDVLVSMLFVDVDPDYQTILPNDHQILNFPLDEPFAGCIAGTLSGEFCVPMYNLVAGPLVPGSEFQVIPANTGRQTLAIPLVEVPSEQQRPRLVTQRTVRDARVIWVGDFPLDGVIFRAAPTPTPIVTVDPNAEEEAAADPDAAPTATPVPPRPDIVTLGVTPQDAVILTYMAESHMPLTFALRSARAVGLPETQAVTLDYILTNFGIQVPDRFTFAVEPAIRSIRQVFLGGTVSLISDAEEASAQTEAALDAANDGG